MHGADEPELRIFKIEPMPGLEQMMDSFALDQRPGKDRAKMRRPHSGREAIHIHAARQIKQFLFGKSLDAKCLRRLFREDEKQVGQIVFLEKPIALQRADLPSIACATADGVSARGARRSALHFAAVAMPGRDFHESTGFRACAPRAAKADNRPTNCETGRSARSPAGGRQSSRDISFSRRSNKGCRETRAAAPGASGANESCVAGISVWRLS